MGQREGRRRRVVIKQPFAAAEQHRVGEQAQFVHQIVGQQLLHQRAAALHQQYRPLRAFQLAQPGEDVPPQPLAVLPRQRLAVVGGDILGGLIEHAGDIGG